MVERVHIARPDRLSRSHAGIEASLHELEVRGVECVSVETPMHLGNSQAARRVAMYIRVGNPHQLD